MDGFRVMPLAEASMIGDFFCTVTGDIHVIDKKHFLAMKDGAIIANSGHFNVELNLAALSKITKSKRHIREFVEESFKCAGIEIRWEGKDYDEKGINTSTGKVVVEVSREYYRPSEVDLLVGNASKAKEHLGWEAKIRFKELVKMMVEEDIKKIKNKKMEGIL